MKKVIFDIETTGADKSKDRIVQLAIHCVDDNGKVLLSKSKLYNPEIPISQAAQDTHGITDEKVKNAPLFSDDAKVLKRIFEDSELIGYNIIQFDIPILMAEFDRAGVALDLSGKVVDVMKLETALNPRTLGAVYKRYTGEEIENAHDAMGDVKATEIVLRYQLEKIYGEGFDFDKVIEQAGIPPGSADFFGKFKYDEEGFLVYNFGKHLNLRVLENADTRKYADWMLEPKQSFPAQVKKLLKDELKKDVAAQFKRPGKDYKIKTASGKFNEFHTHHKEDKISFKPGKQSGLDFDTVDDDLPF